MTDIGRHCRKEPRPSHAERKDQHDVFGDQPDGEAKEGASPGEQERLVGGVRPDRHAARLPVGRNDPSGEIADDKDKRHTDDQSQPPTASRGRNR